MNKRFEKIKQILPMTFLKSMALIAPQVQFNKNRLYLSLSGLTATAAAAQGVDAGRSHFSCTRLYSLSRNTCAQSEGPTEHPPPSPCSHLRCCCCRRPFGTWLCWAGVPLQCVLMSLCTSEAAWPVRCPVSERACALCCG